MTKPAPPATPSHETPLSPAQELMMLARDARIAAKYHAGQRDLLVRDVANEDAMILSHGRRAAVLEAAARQLDPTITRSGA